MPLALWPTCRWKHTALLLHLITFFCTQAKANWEVLPALLGRAQVLVFLVYRLFFRSTRVQVAADWLTLPTHSPVGAPAKRALCWGRSARALSEQVGQTLPSSAR